VAVLAVEGTASAFRAGLEGAEQPVKVRAPDGRHGFFEVDLGTVRIERPGSFSYRLRPDPKHWQPLRVQRVVLRKTEP